MLIISIYERNGQYTLTMDSRKHEPMGWFELNQVVIDGLRAWCDNHEVGKQNVEAAQSRITPEEIAMLFQSKRPGIVAQWWAKVTGDALRREA